LQYVPIDEAHPLKAVSPYGNTKLIIEDILRDVSKSDPEWRIILLRYFNPVGAHPSGRIGEHQVMLNNLMPWVQAVALGHRPVLNVYGTDYDTRDGTCVRDYIHVMDLGGWSQRAELFADVTVFGYACGPVEAHPPLPPRLQERAGFGPFKPTRAGVFHTRMPVLPPQAKGTCLRLRKCWRRQTFAVCLTTWARAQAPQCWKWCTRLKKPLASR
jgi:hypothetical protein